MTTQPVKANAKPVSAVEPMFRLDFMFSLLSAQLCQACGLLVEAAATAKPGPAMLFSAHLRFA